MFSGQGAVAPAAPSSSAARRRRSSRSRCRACAERRTALGRHPGHLLTASTALWWHSKQLTVASARHWRECCRASWAGLGTDVWRLTSEVAAGIVEAMAGSPPGCRFPAIRPREKILAVDRRRRPFSEESFSEQFAADGWLHKTDDDLEQLFGRFKRHR
jgi:hypothetical protein